MVGRDLEYIENLSMLNDVRILVKTPLAVLRMRGAH
jgi:lipopolysaccharide/colanic/teichoic acid biosynthesis glycosyltransferase